MIVRRSKVYVILRNDDFCALSGVDKEARILQRFERLGIPQVAGVIPFVCEDPHDHRAARFHPLTENRQMVELLREYQKKGLLELAQHGVTHRTNRLHPSRSGAGREGAAFTGIDRSWLPYAPLNTEGYSEFNGLSTRTIRQQVRTGKAMIEEVSGRPVETFIFPWDRLNQTSLRVLHRLGFRYVLTGTSTNYERGEPIPAVIHFCHKDLFAALRIIRGIEADGDVLVQAAYHSWMLDGKQEAELEAELAGMAAEGRFEFIRADQIRARLPRADMILPLHMQCARLAPAVNPVLGKKVLVKPYYEQKIQPYLKGFLKLQFASWMYAQGQSSVVTGRKER